LDADHPEYGVLIACRFTAKARPRHGDRHRAEAAGHLTLAMTVPVAAARRHIGRSGGRRAVGRAGFTIAAPMPVIPSSSQRGGQLLLDQFCATTDNVAA
jgi:hypothetical protein